MKKGTKPARNRRKSARYRAKKKKRVKARRNKSPHVTKKYAKA